jgi:hypothetical protein
MPLLLEGGRRARNKNVGKSLDRDLGATSWSHAMHFVEESDESECFCRSPLMREAIQIPSDCSSILGKECF